MNLSPHADLYVLPEMWATGFVMSAKDGAESEDLSIAGGSAGWMRRKAAELQAAVCGSLPIIGNDGMAYNRLYFAMPDGGLVAYDKHHLFAIGGEAADYTPGQERVIVSYKGVRFLLQICYDLRFPVWSRNRKDYDVALYVANWPEKRQPAWRTLLMARAIENQCYVVGCNRTGEDPICGYAGGSMIVSPYGEAMEQADASQCAISAEIDMEKLESFRQKFPALDDSDIL